MPDVNAAAFFDLDRTLIAGSSTFSFALAAWRNGLLPTKMLLGDVSRAAAFRLFGATDDRSETIRDRILDAVRGQEQAALIALNDTLIPELVSQVRPESHNLLAMHQEASRDCWIVSAAPVELVAPLAHALAFDGGIGTQAELRDGRYTGELDGPFVYGEGKAHAVKTLADARGYDLALSYAYTDSVSDLPLLELVGHPVAVNPDAALHAVARQRGWPVVIFAERRKKVVRTTTALTTASAIASVTYTLGRRHGRIVEQSKRGFKRHVPWK